MIKFYDEANNTALAPVDCIYAMYNDTYEGTLNFPTWYGDENDEEYYTCKIYWDKADADKVADKFRKLYANIEEIAASYKRGDDTSAANNVVKASPALFEVWNTYLRPFETDEFDWDFISAIEDKLDAAELSPEELEECGYPAGYNKLTEEEEKYYDRYRTAIYDDCSRRLSGNVCTYQVVIRARRLFRLITLNAPKIILNNEASMLAAAMALNAYGTEMELTKA